MQKKHSKTNILFDKVLADSKLKAKVQDKTKESPYKDAGLETPKKKTPSRPGSAVNNKTANKCKYFALI